MLTSLHYLSSFKLLGVSFCTSMLIGCQGIPDTQVSSRQMSMKAPKQVVFFIGDGMGITTLTAARIYKVGESGSLSIDQLPETAFVRTFSENAQVTDSAPSMGAYMTGVKMKNEVISMQTGTNAVELKNGQQQCDTDPVNRNKAFSETLLEKAISAQYATGIVTTTRVTHATPASTYAHICHRDAENEIAAQLVPSKIKADRYSNYNTRLKNGIDVILGGGKRHFLPTESGGKRQDGRNFLKELKKQGYQVVENRSQLNSLDPADQRKIIGLFNDSHLNYDLDRQNKQINEPSLKEMTLIALQKLSSNTKGFFLMVEGGRIDHALHDTNAKRALQDVIALDDTLQATIDFLKIKDPLLENSLIIITADHDHTLMLNGYVERTGPYLPGQQTSVLGLVKNQNGLTRDINGNPYPVISFGNGKKRPTLNRNDDSVTQLRDDDECRPVMNTSSYTFSYTPSYQGWCTGAAADDFQQEAVIQTGFKDSETHGGTDVFLGAIGQGSDQFSGSLENIDVFYRLNQIMGFEK